jgi:hypothetical protein
MKAHEIYWQGLYIRKRELKQGWKRMNYPAASYGVSKGNYHNAPRGGELVRLRRIKPLSASGGFTHLRRVYPPQEGLFAGGLKSKS